MQQNVIGIGGHISPHRPCRPVECPRYTAPSRSPAHSPLSLCRDLRRQDWPGSRPDRHAVTQAKTICDSFFIDCLVIPWSGRLISTRMGKQLSIDEPVLPRNTPNDEFHDSASIQMEGVADARTGSSKARVFGTVSSKRSSDAGPTWRLRTKLAWSARHLTTVIISSLPSVSR